jgi:anaerobic magnesium-protoporphyrin IX monomethyl ester cyclase
MMMDFRAIAPVYLELARPMKVCFIRPPLLVLARQAGVFELPPLGLAYVVASARHAGHDVSVVDAVGEAPTRNTPPDEGGPFIVRGLPPDEILERVPADAEVLAVSCMFSQDWPYLRRLVAALRRRHPHAPIVAGGEHITALPEFVLGESAIDHCVLGEGEETMVDLLDALGTGRSPRDVPGLVSKLGTEIARSAPRPRIRAIDDIPEPAWELFPIENYLAQGKSFGVDRGRSMPVLATRGCPYQCTFCSSPAMWTTRWQARDPARVLAEIAGYLDRYRADNVDFYDLTAIIKREWILEFCRLIEASGRRFTWQLPTGTRSEAIDEDVAAALYATGCRNITYAPESGSAEELRRIKKKIKVPRVLESMRACHRRGVVVKANIVLGFPGQTVRDLLGTARFVAAMAAVGARDVMIFLFCPYPGSEMYRELLAAGRLPPPSDAYFNSLISTIDVTRAVSFNEHLSARVLGLARVLGMALFYLLSFALRPWRAAETAWRMATGRYETYLEDRLSGFLRRLFPFGWAARRPRIVRRELPAPTPPVA